MNHNQLRKGVREMVVYLLDEEAGKDADVVDGYTETFMSAFERYENDTLKEAKKEIKKNELTKNLMDKNKALRKENIKLKKSNDILMCNNFNHQTKRINN